jgi:hypothetical protein
MKEAADLTRGLQRVDPKALGIHKRAIDALRAGDIYKFPLADLQCMAANYLADAFANGDGLRAMMLVFGVGPRVSFAKTTKLIESVGMRWSARIIP